MSWKIVKKRILPRLLPRRARRKTARRVHRLRVAIGFVILAALIGIGVVPARRGLTVRLTGPSSKAAGRDRRGSRSRR
jgi:hypothetical protein